MNLFKKVMILFVIIFHLLLILFINYSMPNYKAVNIVGAEVKRIDKTKLAQDTPELSKDTYFIYVKDNEKSRVYKNEDTRWGFPFYFKFNSADIQANAVSFLDEKSLVQIKYYGWRINMLDKFPNIVSIKKLDNINDISNPIFSYIFYILTLISMIFLISAIIKKK
ncbi:DUF1523 family protein [Campylobacter sp. MG1]|uniref:DUF1523 family protein n=1 Tax=Campylobacter sp. MG1 TaxID=2976332 RepID=UPI00226CF4D2|nr:DUF1523 family protein [Campylobacter sp. MG1]